MYKTVFAVIAAASLTLAGANPVQAQSLTEEQIGKLLFGLVATAVVAAIIDNANDRAPKEVATIPNTGWQNPEWSPQGLFGPRRDHPRHDQPRYEPYTLAPHLVIPSQCLSSYQTRGGTVRMFLRSCMRENYHQVASLPASCVVRAITTEGPRNGWDPKCLSDKGYRISRLR